MSCQARLWAAAQKDSAVSVVNDSMESVDKESFFGQVGCTRKSTVPIQGDRHPHSNFPHSNFPRCSGYVLLLSSKTKQWAADFKLNSTATAVIFSPDSRYVLASCADANVYKFDVRSRRCVLRFFNEVCVCVFA